MGWMVWHLTRVQDSIISRLKGEEQLWIRDKWHTKFNRPSDPQDTGGGHSPEDVAAFKSPDVEILLGYHRSVLERSKEYIAGLSIADLAKEVDDPRFKTPPTVGQMLAAWSRQERLRLPHSWRAFVAKQVREFVTWP